MSRRLLCSLSTRIIPNIKGFTWNDAISAGCQQIIHQNLTVFPKLSNCQIQHRTYGVFTLSYPRTEGLRQCQLLKLCTNCSSRTILTQVEQLNWKFLKKFHSGNPGFTPPIQKQIQKLSSKRPARKKTAEKNGEKKSLKAVTAYAAADQYNLEFLNKALDEQGLYLEQTLPEDAFDALHLKAKYNVDCEEREIFFFREGCVVFWNVPELERNEVLRFSRKYCSEPYNMDIVLGERESLDFIEAKEKTGLKGDTVNLKQIDEAEATPELLQELTLQKYAFSNALSLSVKLAIWEASLEKFIDSIEPVTEDLRRGRKLRRTRQKVLQETGELFTLRHLINLSSDLLDTPDFYWDRGDLEALYLKTCSHLNINRRTKVINEKLSHCCELTDLLSSHLNDQHHTRLEWMIIILILVEVVFEIIHYIERYLSSSSTTKSDIEIHDDS